MKHTFLSQIQAIVPVFVALSVMLSACSISVPHNNAPSNTSTNEPEANLSVEISHIAYGDFLSSRVATPNGLYLLQNIYPACTSLCYIDMQAQQEIFLCSNPNCTHSSANCNAYLPVNDDYFSYPPRNKPDIGFFQNGGIHHEKNQQTFSHPCNHLCYGYGHGRSGVCGLDNRS